MTQFIPINTKEQFVALSALAHEIWTEHYLPIIGASQTDYMLEKFQSESAFERQITQENYRYFFLSLSGETTGYLGIQTQVDALFLSKLYVHSSFRRRGIARDAMAFTEGFARGAGLPRVYLTVNRNNDGSVATYKKLGFANAGTLDTDIGAGYIMEDFVFEKLL